MIRHIPHRPSTGAPGAENSLRAKIGRFAAVVLAGLLILAAGCSTAAPPPPLQDDLAAGTNSLRLDYRPMREPEAVYLTLQPDGAAEYLRYSPQTLRIVSRRTGSLPARSIAPYFTRAEAHPVRQALTRGNYTGNGLLQGDQFYLGIRTPGAQGQVFGFVQETPVEVQTLVRDLLKLEGSLRPAAPAPAYVRIETVAAARLDSVRKAGKLKLAPFSELPAPLRTSLEGKLDLANHLAPTSKAAHSALLKLAAGSHELIVLQGAKGYQLTAFTSLTNQEGKEP